MNGDLRDLNRYEQSVRGTLAQVEPADLRDILLAALDGWAQALRERVRGGEDDVVPPSLLGPAVGA